MVKLPAKTFWKAIHTDRVIDSKNLSEDYKPYLKITRGNLQKVVFYEKDNEKNPIITFDNPKNIFFRLRPLLKNGVLQGRRWIIENDNKICIIDYENKPHFYDSYEDAGTFPLNKSPIDSL